MLRYTNFGQPGDGFHHHHHQPSSLYYLPWDNVNTERLELYIYHDRIPTSVCSFFFTQISSIFILIRSKLSSSTTFDLLSIETPGERFRYSTMYPFKETGDEDAVLSVLPREDYDWPLELGVDNVDDPSLGRSPVYFGSDDEAALSMPYDSIFGNSNGFGLQAEDFQGSQMPQLEFPIVREQRHQPFYSPLREVAPIVQGVPEAVEQYGLPDANYLPMEQPGNYHEWAQLYGFPPTVSSHSSQVVQQRAQTLTTWPPLEHPSLAQQMAQTTQTTHALGPPPGPIYTHIKPRLVSRPTESLVTPRPILPLVEPVSLPTKQPTTPVSEHTPSDVQSTRDRYDAVPRSFMTADEAKSYRTRVRKMPNPDTTVSEIEENKVAWVGFVYQAMISLDQAMDRPKETLTGKATANHDFAAWVGCTYDQKEVEAAAWHVVVSQSSSFSFIANH